MKALLLIFMTIGLFLSKSLMASDHILNIDFHEVHNTVTDTYATTMQLNRSLDLTGYPHESKQQPISASDVIPRVPNIHGYLDACYIGSASFGMVGNWWKFDIPPNHLDQYVKTMGSGTQSTGGTDQGYLGFMLSAGALWIFDPDKDPATSGATPIFTFPTVQNQTVSSVFYYSLSEMGIDLEAPPGGATLFEPNRVYGGAMNSQNYINYRTFQSTIPEPRFALFLYPILSIFLLQYRSVRRPSRI